MNIKVNTNDVGDLAALVAFLKTVERCCREGASRELTLHVDGDGSARMFFEFSGVEGVEGVKPHDVNRKLEFYIGE